MILIIDNYDSFTYSLYQCVGGLGSNVRVVYNDKTTLEEIEALSPSHILISSGAGRPVEFGVCKTAVRHFAGRLPILGVGLGHQIVCETFGARIVHARTPMHGKCSKIHIANGSPLFRGLPPLLEVGRYHSLIAERDSLTDDLLVTAETDEGEVMGVKHREHTVYGLQFNPESILTPDGGRILENFVRMGGEKND